MPNHRPSVRRRSRLPLPGLRLCSEGWFIATIRGKFLTRRYSRPAKRGYMIAASDRASLHVFPGSPAPTASPRVLVWGRYGKAAGLFMFYRRLCCERATRWGWGYGACKLVTDSQPQPHAATGRRRPQRQVTSRQLNTAQSFAPAPPNCTHQNDQYASSNNILCCNLEPPGN